MRGSKIEPLIFIYMVGSIFIVSTILRIRKCVSMNIEKAKEVDIVEYLANLGYQPIKIKEPGYWYKSPLRDEKTASFKVNRKMNRWFDFGDGRYGNVIDFGILYHKCTVSEFLQKLDHSSLAFKPTVQVQEPSPVRDSKIQILSEHEISSYALSKYIESRKINPEIADKFCKEIRYKIDDKIYYAIGFKNNSGGYEIRNKHFKGSSSPKDITLINNDSKTLTVFEGFFDFLSYLSIHSKQEEKLNNFLVLNSSVFFDKTIPVMMEYKSIHLYLDNDATGQNCSRKVLGLDKEKFKDESHLYQKHNDLNAWLTQTNHSQKPSLGQKP